MYGNWKRSVAILRAASSVATSVMDGWSMPAPAPCANTKQAEAARGSWSSAETRLVSSIARVSRSADVVSLVVTRYRELSWLSHRDEFPGGSGSVGGNAV